MLEEISNILVNLVDSIGAAGIFIASVVESFFPPIPSEVVLISAGFNASERNALELIPLFSVAAAVGNFVGTLPFYLVSRYGAETFLPKFLDKWGKFLLISNADLERVEKLFQKRGNIAVFLSKLIPGIRSIVAFPAGLSKMNFFKYTVFSILGSLVWNTFLILVGYVAFEQKDKIFELLKPFEVLVLGALILILIVYFVKIILNIYHERQKAKEESTVSNE